MPESYLFVFGRTPELSLLELQSLYPDARMVVTDVAMVSTDSVINGTDIINTLGGTIKIARVLDKRKAIDASVEQYFPSEQSISFGISVYGNVRVEKDLLREIKTRLEGRNVHSRYLTPHKSEKSLSSAVLQDASVHEIIAVQDESNVIIGKTVAVQDIDLWTRRDYGRPFADAKRGMLPIKVARMIVNIAKSNLKEFGKSERILYDPFCGMGTILGEAYQQNFTVMGSDISEEAVLGANKNLQWLQSTFPSIQGKILPVTVCDAVHVSDRINPNSVDTIVTEPFMGDTQIGLQSTIDVGKVKNTIKGLEKLYIGCFKDWKKILKKNGTIVISLPSYAIDHRIYAVKKVVDMCEILGYTIEVGPIEYSRPNAIVKRNFYKFIKN